MTRSLTPDRFMAYLIKNCTTAQIEKLREKMQEGWKPFRVGGTVTDPLIFCSRTTGVRSNIAPGHDHMRIYKGGECVRYDPRRK